MVAPAKRVFQGVIGLIPIGIGSRVVCLFSGRSSTSILPWFVLL